MQFFVVAATRLSEHAEVNIWRDLLEDMSHEIVDSHDWYEQLANLGITEAALLPPTEEAEGRLRRFVVAPRLTNHVRHRTRYFNTPVSKQHEFVFTTNGHPAGESAATLQGLAAPARRVNAEVSASHSRHHDFSRWIANLFCDRDLANDVRRLESAMKRDGKVDAFVAGLCETVENRYRSNCVNCVRRIVCEGAECVLRYGKVRGGSDGDIRRVCVTDGARLDFHAVETRETNR